jgi:hypothetical protein
MESVKENPQCHSPTCDHPTPLDMTGVRVDDETFCSPGCALAALEEMDDADSIAFNDPQFFLDPSIFDCDEQAAIYETEVRSKADAEMEIGYVEDESDITWCVGR